MKYKVTFFFIVTYWIVDPMLYLHFGNAYIAGSTTENKWLVFFAGPFSFSEDFKAGTPLNQALQYAALSANFWITAGTILIGEHIVNGNYRIFGFSITMGKSYTIGVCASYLASGFIFLLPATQHPITGTSIISLSLLLTYFVSYPWVVIRRLRKLGDEQNQASINALLASSSGIILFSIYFYIINPAAYLHILGVSIFAAIYSILIRRSIQNVKTNSENEVKAQKF